MSGWITEVSVYSSHYCSTFSLFMAWVECSVTLSLDFFSPQTETVDSRSACTARAAHSYHQITTLFPTRVRSWRHGLQVIWLNIKCQRMLSDTSGLIPYFPLLWRSCFHVCLLLCFSVSWLDCQQDFTRTIVPFSQNLDEGWDRRRIDPIYFSFF